MTSDNNKAIKELLEIIKNKVGKIEARQGIQSIQIDSMKDQLSVLNEKVDGVQTDVTGLKSGVTGLKTDLAGLKADVKKLNKKADGILEYLHNVDEDVYDHEKRLKRIESIPAATHDLKF